jgi:hypothetical protein
MRVTGIIVVMRSVIVFAMLAPNMKASPSMQEYSYVGDRSQYALRGLCIKSEERFLDVSRLTYRHCMRFMMTNARTKAATQNITSKMETS